MITTFRTLFTVNIDHGYYSADCRDFEIFVPAGTADMLRNGKLIARMRNGKLNVLYEADQSGSALAPIAGTTLRFGMKLLNPLFSNITDFDVTTPLYRNTLAEANLDPPLGVFVTGRILSHAFTKALRPVTVTVSNPDGQLLQMETITEDYDRSTITCDLYEQAPGAYRVVEEYPDGTETASYYSDQELLQSGIFGIVEIKVAGGFYTSRPSFTISFNAKREILKYYVVAGNYSANEFRHLSVEDNGFAEDGRSRINFTRVPSEAFTSAEIPPALLAKTGDKVVLFKSQSFVERCEKARTKIQLSKNGDVLIKHLPQIGADKAGGDVIIHISRP